MNIYEQKRQQDEKYKHKIFQKKNNLPKIININKHQKKNSKSENFIKYKYQIKQILSKYGLSMYLKNFYDLNFDFFKIGLLNQNGFNDLVKTLKIFPGHLVRMENLYNYLKSNINEFKIEKSNSVEKPKTANGSKIKNKTFYNNNTNNNLLKINRPFTTFYNYNKTNKKKYKSLNKREINKNSFNLNIYHENNKILQNIINKNFNIDNYNNNKQNQSEINKNNSTNKYFINAENDSKNFLKSENVDLLLKFYMEKLNKKLEESYSTVHDSSLSEINLSKNNINNIYNSLKNQNNNNNNNINLNFKNKLPEINKTKELNNNNEEKKNNSINKFNNNNNINNIKNKLIKKEKQEIKNKIEENKNNLISDKIEEKNNENINKNSYKKEENKINNNINKNKKDHKQLILKEFKKNEDENNIKNIDHKTIPIKKSSQNEINNNENIEEEIIEEKITDSDKKISSKYNNENKDNKDIINILSNEAISSILTQKNSNQNENQFNQNLNDKENIIKNDSPKTELNNNNNNKKNTVEEETEIDKEFLEKFSSEEDIYSNIRLNKSDDFTYIYQDLDNFDVEYMCRCLGLCLMYLIENSCNKEHIIDLNYKIKFFNKNLNDIQYFFKNFNPNKIVTNLEILINKNNKTNNLIKFHNKKKFSDIEKDIKFIDEFFTVQKKNKKYENLSDKAKNVLSKELSYINEVNSEMSNNTTKNNIIINELNDFDNKNESSIKEEQEENIKTEDNNNNNNNNIDNLTSINNKNENENNNIENTNNSNNNNNNNNNVNNNNNNTDISNNQTEINNNSKDEKVIFDLLKNIENPSENKLKEFFLKEGEIFDDDYLFQYKVIPKKKPIQFPDPQTIFEFCANIMILCKFQKDVILLCLIYIEKLIYNTGILLTHRNWRRIIFTSMLISNKFLDEESIDNYMVVKIFPHLKLNEVNLLEEKFLEMINFQTFVGLKEYFMSYFIIKSIALKYNWNGTKLVKIDVEKMMKIQEYAYIMQKKMKKNIKRSNSI